MRRTVGLLALAAPLAVPLTPAWGQTERLADLHRMGPWRGDPTESIAVGDLDGEADPDGFAANLGEPNRPLRNTTRQRPWRGVPRIAKSMTMDVWGAAGEAWFLLLSIEPGNASLPYGMLRLDPSVVIPAGTGVLDGQGSGSLALLVPNNPNLVLFPLYFQVLYGLPLALSNLEIAAFTDL